MHRSKHYHCIAFDTNNLELNKHDNIYINKIYICTLCWILKYMFAINSHSFLYYKYTCILAMNFHYMYVTLVLTFSVLVHKYSVFRKSYTIVPLLGILLSLTYCHRGLLQSVECWCHNNSISFNSYCTTHYHNMSLCP